MTNILVDSDRKLINLSSRLEGIHEIGLDTEFIRESTYRPILALIQISLPSGEIYLIDPLCINDRTYISKILENPRIIKIIHSAKQDIEALYNYTKVYPKNLFDTQIASNFLSEKSNIGYSALINSFFDVDLKEGSWRTDWLARPLNKKKIDYASDDVRYLIRAKKILVNKLEELKRLSWFEEEQANELKKSNIILDPKTAWEKINYPLYFDSKELKLLKDLANWREILSMKYNIPKRWILSDSLLIKIMISSDKKSLEIISSIKQKLTDKESSDLKEMLSNRKKIKNKNIAPNKLLVTKCSELLLDVSNKFNIDSTVIANKRDLETFSIFNDKARFMKGWRYQIFGKLVQ